MHLLRLRPLIILLSALLPGAAAFAQSDSPQPLPSLPPDHDTSCYESFSQSIVGRFYFSRKFTSLEMEKPSGPRLRYQPNTRLNMGVGVTYHGITINLAYGFPFLNPENGKGKTKYLDLQTHFYARKWTVDLLGQFYKGYYLDAKGVAAPSAGSYYVRPDIGIDMVGAAAYRLSNWDRFSYRAPVFQDERQLKSGGSFLVGGEAYYGVVKADSSVVPYALKDQYSQSGMRSLRFFKIGPGAGYAYTFIIASSFFCMASLQANLGVDFTHQIGGATGKGDRVSLSPGYIYRFVAGYDKGLFNVNFAIVGNQLNIKSGVSEDKIFITTGVYRLTFSYRFSPGPGLRRRLRPIDDLFD